jgi:hypothetical protein
VKKVANSFHGSCGSFKLSATPSALCFSTNYSDAKNTNNLGFTGYTHVEMTVEIFSILQSGLRLWISVFPSIHPRERNSLCTTYSIVLLLVERSSHELVQATHHFLHDVSSWTEACIISSNSPLPPIVAGDMEFRRHYPLLA